MPGIVMECRGEAGPEAWYPDAVQRATCVPLRNTKRGGGGGGGKMQELGELKGKMRPAFTHRLK